MSVIVLLIVAGAVVAGGFLMAFVWAVRSGQFDDTFTPAIRVLLDAGSGPRPPARHSMPATARPRRSGFAAKAGDAGSENN